LERLGIPAAWFKGVGVHDHEHPVPTRLNGLRYLFTAKHHGGWRSRDATWLPTLAEDHEFSVFDDAEAKQIADSSGNLFGLLNDADGGLQDLGTRGEQIAKFWKSAPGRPWHGFPAFPLKDDLVNHNRQGQTARPEKQIFDPMLQVEAIDRAAWKRLKKGKHA
jgi:hypothetical protein